jgi:hypothetical protein
MAARHVSRGCAFGDFDNDGDLDILVMNQNDPPSLIRNDAPAGNHWLKIRLEGTKSNRSAIGARVLVRYGGKVQAQELMSQTATVRPTIRVCTSDWVRQQPPTLSPVHPGGQSGGGSVPCSVEAHASIGRPRSNRAVVGLVLYCHVRSALALNTIPERGDRLSIGKGPGERPTGQCGASRVFNRDSRAECAGVLRRDSVDNVASCAASTHRQRDGGGCCCGAGGSGDGHR